MQKIQMKTISICRILLCRRSINLCTVRYLRQPVPFGSEYWPLAHVVNDLLILVLSKIRQFAIQETLERLNIRKNNVNFFRSFSTEKLELSELLFLQKVVPCVCEGRKYRKNRKNRKANVEKISFKLSVQQAVASARCCVRS